jgi:hypothetical protein
MAKQSLNNAAMTVAASLGGVTFPLGPENKG